MISTCYIVTIADDRKIEWGELNDHYGDRPIHQEIIQPYLTSEIYQKLKMGDLIDTEQYRGKGLLYYDGENFWKTVGEYGYFLPEVAWAMVEEKGIEFFAQPENSCGVEFILIPVDRKIQYYSEEEKEQTPKPNDRSAMYLYAKVSVSDYVRVNMVNYDKSYATYY